MAKKIMFSDKYGLTEAVLTGRKTMTRRVAVLPGGLARGDLWHPVMGIDERGKVYFTFDCIDAKQRDLYPQYQIGEVLAVAQCYSDIPWAYREQWRKQGINLNIQKNGTLKGLVELPGWTNKMFVRADAMPHQIRITNIRIERLQDISDGDCRREGIMECEFMNTCDTFYYDHWGDVPNHITFRTLRQAFASLIDKTCGKGTWQSNPWTWNYEFELIKKQRAI